MSVRLALILIIISGVGCATTVVKKDPRPRDRGIRYYRPKPYLLVTPSASKPTELVSISLEYLPDFSEEYSITVRSGIGVNETQVTLKDGWNLTQINQKLDSQTDDNLNALANVLGAVPKLAVPTSADDQPTNRPMEIRANNVPYGYYESVISRDYDGRKKLYGWRYIGFAPFSNCPLEMCGSEGGPCGTQALYGLRMLNGVMTFCLIHEIAGTAYLPLPEETPPAPVETAQLIIDTYKTDITKLIVNGSKEVLSGIVPEVALAPDPQILDQINITLVYPKTTVLGSMENQASIRQKVVEKATGINSSIAGGGKWKFKVVKMEVSMVD